jgi:hypothetical protein
LNGKSLTKYCFKERASVAALLIPSRIETACRSAIREQTRSFTVGTAACKHMIPFADCHPVDTMDGYDTMTMSYLGNAMPVGLLPNPDYLQSGIDMQDHMSTFETETYMR